MPLKLRYGSSPSFERSAVLRCDLVSEVEIGELTSLTVGHDGSWLFSGWFLDRIATHILAFEGNSHIEFFNGNYSEYDIDYKKRAEDAGFDTTPKQLPHQK